MALSDLTPEQFAEIDEKSRRKEEERRRELFHTHINVLIEGIRIGQEKGAYELEEARIFMNSIDALQNAIDDS
jgi:hypothetical protein